jgi:transposase-like protein
MPKQTKASGRGSRPPLSEGAGGVRGSLTIQQKYDYAKLLYISQGVTIQKELASRTGVSPQTINKWVNEDNRQWDRLRESLIVTKEQEMRRLYMQITELNDFIFKKPEGQRFANSKESDVLSKLTKSIRELETETSLSEIMEVMKSFLGYVRTIPDVDIADVHKIIQWADQFVKSNIRK